jgi:hypothetical protein
VNIVEEHNCEHCASISQIIVLEDAEKATAPMIKFYPFCGMSNQYPKQI